MRPLSYSSISLTSSAFLDSSGDTSMVRKTSGEEIKKIKEEDELIMKKAKEYMNIFAKVIE